jgi:hypothetical protein
MRKFGAPHAALAAALALSFLCWIVLLGGLAAVTVRSTVAHWASTARCEIASSLQLRSRHVLCNALAGTGSEPANVLIKRGS